MDPKELVNLLKERGYPVEHHAEGGEIVIHHIKPHHIEKLKHVARQLGHEHVIHSEGGKHTVHPV
jgi:hypothetical protein